MVSVLNQYSSKKVCKKTRLSLKLIKKGVLQSSLKKSGIVAPTPLFHNKRKPAHPQLRQGSKQDHIEHPYMESLAVAM